MQKPYKAPTVVDLDPCTACKRALRALLDDAGAEAMAKQIAPLMTACAACRAQIPRRPDFTLVTGLKEIDGKAAN